MEASDRTTRSTGRCPRAGRISFRTRTRIRGSGSTAADAAIPAAIYYNNDKYTYVCTYRRANRDKYPYTIRVTKNGTDILKSDPTVLNN